jgi:hypothetical protein
MRFQVISKKAVVVLAIASAAIYGCTNKKADTPSPSNPVVTCDTASPTFSGTVNPIIQQSCAIGGCHDHPTQAGGYDYSTYTGLKLAVQNQRLIGAIKHQAGFVAMPETGPMLSDCDIEKISEWVTIGAPNN